MLQYLSHLPLKWRVILSYLLTDEAYAVSIRRFTDRPVNQHMHYHLLGSGLMLFMVWQLSTLAGIVLGKAIPAEFELGFAIPLSFLAIVLPLLRKRAEYVAGCVAGVVALSCQALPWNSWLILAAICGIIAGMATESLNASSAQAKQ